MQQRLAVNRAIIPPMCSTRLQWNDMLLTRGLLQYGDSAIKAIQPDGDGDGLRNGLSFERVAIFSFTHPPLFYGELPVGGYGLAAARQDKTKRLRHSYNYNTMFSHSSPRLDFNGMANGVSGFFSPLSVQLGHQPSQGSEMTTLLHNFHSQFSPAID